ncbi:MAG: LPS assembly lipoprotein LptE [Victivallaceae bacterium]|nr:LPS assembly lipoprotein LptE [Victivallaceae bacterium]
MKTLFQWIVPLWSLCMCCGCGYQIGYLGHPQLKTVAIAPVINETLIYNIAPQVRTALAECFQTDGTMKVVSETKADCIVYAKVVDCKYSQVSYSSETTDKDLNPDQWSATVTIEYSVMIPGRAAPLIKNNSASGSATFTSGADLEISRAYAGQQAAFTASKNVVIQVTEAW